MAQLQGRDVNQAYGADEPGTVTGGTFPLAAGAPSQPSQTAGAASTTTAAPAGYGGAQQERALGGTEAAEDKPKVGLLAKLKAKVTHSDPHAQQHNEGLAGEEEEEEEDEYDDADAAGERKPKKKGLLGKVKAKVMQVKEKVAGHSHKDQHAEEEGALGREQPMHDTDMAQVAAGSNKTRVERSLGASSSSSSDDNSTGKGRFSDSPAAAVHGGLTPSQEARGAALPAGAGAGADTLPSDQDLLNRLTERDLQAEPLKPMAAGSVAILKRDTPDATTGVTSQYNKEMLPQQQAPSASEGVLPPAFAAGPTSAGSSFQSAEEGNRGYPGDAGAAGAAGAVGGDLSRHKGGVAWTAGGQEGAAEGIADSGRSRGGFPSEEGRLQELPIALAGMGLNDAGERAGGEGVESRVANLTSGQEAAMVDAAASEPGLAAVKEQMNRSLAPGARDGVDTEYAGPAAGRSVEDVPLPSGMVDAAKQGESDSRSYTQQAGDAYASVRDTAAEKLGYNSEATAGPTKPLTTRAAETASAGSQYVADAAAAGAGSVASGAQHLNTRVLGDEQKPFTERAKEGLAAGVQYAAQTAAAAAGTVVGGIQHLDTRVLGDEQRPASARVGEAAASGGQYAADSLAAGSGAAAAGVDHVTRKFQEGAVSAGEGGQALGEEAEREAKQPQQTRAFGAGDDSSLGLSDDSVRTGGPTLREKAGETAGEIRDVVASKLGYYDDVSQQTAAEPKPLTTRLYETVASGTGAMASMIGLGGEHHNAAPHHDETALQGEALSGASSRTVDGSDFAGSTALPAGGSSAAGVGVGAGASPYAPIDVRSAPADGASGASIAGGKSGGTMVVPQTGEAAAGDSTEAVGGSTATSTTGVEGEAPKSLYQSVVDTAFAAKDAVASRVGYGGAEGGNAAGAAGSDRLA